VQPNLPVLGPKYGKALGGIRAALMQADASEIAVLVEAGSNITLTVQNGTTVKLLPSEVLVNLRKREGYAAAQSADATVVLDTNLSPALIQEGVARDVVRAIQDARKQLELNIEDTIDVRYRASERSVANAIEGHAEYISREVLAKSLESSDVSGADGYARLKVGTAELEVSITKAD
jgi:isoleucyl-tRNA synthetase